MHVHAIRNHRRPDRAILTTLALALMIAGCGDDGSSAGAATGGSSGGGAGSLGGSTSTGGSGGGPSAGGGTAAGGEGGGAGESCVPSAPDEIVGNDADDDCDGLVDERPADIADIFHLRGAFWMECGSAHTDFGLNRPVVMANKGAVPGAINLRFIHPGCSPHHTPMTLAQVQAWAADALADPDVDGLALDHEGWTLALGVPLLQTLYEAAEAADKVFCDVPSMYLNHHMAGTSSFAEMLAALQQWTHCASPWRYHLTGPEYLALQQLWIDGGYSHPILPMGDSGWRPQYGGITVQDALATVNLLADAGVSFALFNPGDRPEDQQVIALMQTRYP